ncbi:hypothetical protein WCE55_09765 [Luteimonas sp. MJ293]|uniref:hypothetical protein n=1 Tax=Luteimonas sp. MJ146 TaxID=3129240 RepID=UPI0031B9CA0E
MPLQPLFAEVDPGWYADKAGPVDQRLVARAGRSQLGRRLLARTLLQAGAADALLAPRPGHAIPSAVLRWPRARLAALIRDLGVLAYAPLIRAEVGRDSVRRLKRALGSSYLLPLDRTIWNARVEDDVLRRQQQAWTPLMEALRTREDDAALHALFERQGRSELRGWAAQRDRPLGEWVALLHPPEEPGPAHLPEKPVLLLVTHHETKREGP